MRVEMRSKTALKWEEEGSKYYTRQTTEDEDKSWEKEGELKLSLEREGVTYQGLVQGRCEGRAQGE